MASRFQDKLKEIRDASSRQSEALQKVRNSADLERSLKTVHGFEYREKVESVIEDLGTGFHEEAPGFELTRGFFEGKYMLALRHVEELVVAGERGHHAFSRISFLLAPHSEDDTFEIQCRKTIRDRDLETQTLTVPMEESSFDALSLFIEEQFLVFAKGYFNENGAATPPSAVTT